MFDLYVLAVAARLALALQKEDRGVDVHGPSASVRVSRDVAERHVEQGAFGQVHHALVAILQLAFKLRRGVDVMLQGVPRDVELGGDGAQRREPAQLADYFPVVCFRENFRRLVFALDSAHVGVALSGLAVWPFLCFGFWARHFSFLHSVRQTLAFSSG